MSYNQPPQNPYAQGPAQESGYGYGQANPYAEEPYELNNYGNSNNQYTANAAPPLATSSTTTPLTKNEFLDRVQQLRNDIRNLTTDIEYIGQLHQRSLGSTSGSGGQASQELEHYVSQTQIRNTAIKDGIKGLQRDLANTTDSSRNTKETQLQSLRTLFESELDKYRSLESEYSKRYRDQIARQYRIVNPDASEDEVQEAAYADWGDDGVFQTAVSDTHQETKVFVY
jgi:syntaxin 1B/2/3